MWPHPNSGAPPAQQPQQWQPPTQQPQQWQPPANNQKTPGRRNTPFSNTTKVHQNLKYCFSCGYDMDHDGTQCPVAHLNPRGHIPRVHHKDAHLCPGASMRGQHKTLPDGTGAGQGWLITQSTHKGLYTMAQQGKQPWANVFNVPQGDNANQGGGYQRYPTNQGRCPRKNNGGKWRRRNGGNYPGHTWEILGPQWNLHQS